MLVFIIQKTYMINLLGDKVNLEYCCFVMSQSSLHILTFLLAYFWYHIFSLKFHVQHPVGHISKFSHSVSRTHIIYHPSQIKMCSLESLLIKQKKIQLKFLMPALYNILSFSWKINERFSVASIFNCVVHIFGTLPVFSGSSISTYMNMPMSFLGLGIFLFFTERRWIISHKILRKHQCPWPTFFF